MYFHYPLGFHLPALEDGGQFGKIDIQQKLGGASFALQLPPRRNSSSKCSAISMVNGGRVQSKFWGNKATTRATTTSARRANLESAREAIWRLCAGQAI